MLNTHGALAQMNRFRDELDRVFGVEPVGWAKTSIFPPVNIWEDDNALYIEAELPGLKMEDLEIYLHEGNELSIKGNRPKAELESGSWLHQERSAGEFSRTFKLAVDIDVDKISAELDAGVLRVTLPKSEAVKPKKIEIKVAG